MNIDALINKYLNEAINPNLFFDKKSYETTQSIDFNRLEYNKIYAYSYKNAGMVRWELFKFLGYSDTSKKYGGSGPKFKNWSELCSEYNIKSMKNLQKLRDHVKYKYNVYMCAEFDDGDTKESPKLSRGCYFYPFKAAWVRGTGQDKITFYEVREI